MTSPVVEKLGFLLKSWKPNIPDNHFTTHPADQGDEFHARWYLHPTQHAFEGIVCLLISLPIIAYFVNEIKGHFVKNKVEYKPTKVQYIWSIVLLSSLLFQLPVRLSKIEMASHPAFFLQPCHVSSVIFFLSTLFPSDSAFAWMHCTSLLTWGPSLAFCFPNFPAGFPSFQPLQGIRPGPKSWHHTLNPNLGPKFGPKIQKMFWGPGPRGAKFGPQGPLAPNLEPLGPRGPKFGPQFNYLGPWAPRGPLGPQFGPLLGGSLQMWWL